jgi:hypothetical protein
MIPTSEAFGVVAYEVAGRTPEQDPAHFVGWFLSDNRQMMADEQAERFQKLFPNAQVVIVKCVKALPPLRVKKHA